jgi:hypothetical protein
LVSAAPLPLTGDRLGTVVGNEHDERLVTEWTFRPLLIFVELLEFFSLKRIAGLEHYRIDVGSEPHIAGLKICRQAIVRAEALRDRPAPVTFVPRPLFGVSGSGARPDGLVDPSRRLRTNQRERPSC